MLTIGKVAAQAGVGIDTVRFYERGGLLNRPRRTAAGYRLYGDDDVARLRFIRRAKSLGFSLEEIAELLALNDGGGRRQSVREIAERRLAEVTRRIEELKRIRRTLAHLVHECRTGDGPLAGCPIIQAMLGKAPVSQTRRRAATAHERRRVRS